MENVKETQCKNTTDTELVQCTFLMEFLSFPSKQAKYQIQVSSNLNDTYGRISRKYVKYVGFYRLSIKKNLGKVA